ncbi:sugar ABC transporter substrate-binding protein [Paenibacillus sp. FSL M7-0896]|uniref:ABC transporter substrate-binding protein n=1 Tax=Paenibacillus sp. FSL M7-0896 TaxID=2921610 RepID=UPI0030D9AAF9
MRITKKAILTSLLLGLAGTSLAGCGGTNNLTDNSAASTNSGEEPVTIKWYVTSGNGNLPSTQQLLADYKAESGVNVELQIIPGDGDAIYKKIDVDLSAGGDVDLITMQNAIVLSKYANNDWLLPLNDIYKEASYDYETEFGKNLSKFNGDTIYTLPDSLVSWVVFYNKKIFDDANVPYPSGEWTWDQYIETAKKLTDPSKGIYGSSMPDYDIILYLLAQQRGVNAYKADGTSNYDDPAFKESLQWYGDFGNKLKIQPSWLEIKSKKIPYDAFMTGKYGMQLIGSWYTFAPQDLKTYPRDWKIGITQIPVDPQGKNSISTSGGVAINKASKHPKEAADFIKWFAENNYKYSGGMTAQVNLNEEESDKLFTDMAAKFPTLDGITAEELKSALVTPNLGVVPEKITGSIPTDYGNIILQEGELYLVGQKSLDDTIMSIKTRADEAIQKQSTVK